MRPWKTRLVLRHRPILTAQRSRGTEVSESLLDADPGDGLSGATDGATYGWDGSVAVAKSP
jgi:hypothetical protein